MVARGGCYGRTLPVKRNEKLRAVLVGLGIRHGNHPTPLELEARVKLILKRLPVYRLSPWSSNKGHATPSA